MLANRGTRCGGGRAVAGLAGFLACAAAAGAATSLADADAAFARRGEGFVEAPAPDASVRRAIAAYEDVLASEPENLEAMWKLLRAIEFLGEYTALAPEERRELYSGSVEWAERALRLLHPEGDVKGREPEELAQEAAGRPQAAHVHYWAALHWGLFGDTHNAMAALKKGVADRIRQHAETAILLDAAADSAGGPRILGRMHAKAPKVPLFTGWIDRDEAVRLLEKAYELAPEDPFNRVFLAESWLAFRPEKVDRAVELLRSVVDGEPPDPEARVEHAEAVRQARELLAGVR